MTPDAESCGIETTANGVNVRVYVAPRASSNKVMSAHNRELKIALTAPPVEGAANKALVEFVAKMLDAPKGSVTLVSGEASRHKVLRVQGIGAQEVWRRLSPGE